MEGVPAPPNGAVAGCPPNGVLIVDCPPNGVVEVVVVAPPKGVNGAPVEGAPPKRDGVGAAPVDGAPNRGVDVAPVEGAPPKRDGVAVVGAAPNGVADAPVEAPKRPVDGAVVDAPKSGAVEPPAAGVLAPKRDVGALAVDPKRGVLDGALPPKREPGAPNEGALKAISDIRSARNVMSPVVVRKMARTKFLDYRTDHHICS